MKKFLTLMLCLVFVTTMLVSCADPKIGDYLGEYDYKPEVVEDLTLNMYIITDDTTVKNAIDTVAQMISSYTATNMRTTLKMHYCTAAEYNAKVNAAINAPNDDANAANIVLVNSASMVQSLVQSNKLVNLAPYLDSKAFGTLNVQIADALIQGAMMGNYGDEIYAVPNNRVVEKYEYLVINKEVAIQTLKFSPTEISSYKTLDDAKSLIEKIDAHYGADSHKQYVYTVSGMYEKKAELEAAGNICNIMKYPTVTAEVAYASGFAIVNRDDKHNERAMQVIYAINTDATLRNLLQYGVKGTNYNVNSETGDIVRVKDSENLYSMNLLYTGDIFKADYCSELLWTKTVAENGAKQNKDAVSE